MSKAARTIVLVDPDFRRRAAISHCLSGGGIHVEPFETIDELTRHWPAQGILLVHDEQSVIRDLFETMANTGRWLPVVGFAELADPRRIADTMFEGTVDYLVWPFAWEVAESMLARALERAEMAGSARLREAMARSRIDRLTRREREVLAGVADGLSNRLIGQKLEISPRTVEIHRANMLNKMGASHTSEAIRIAIEGALVR